MAQFSNVIGSDETLPVTQHHDVYPFIDPNQYFSSQTFKGQVVLITGASRGIGQELALQYSKAGASLVLVSRRQEGLDETRAAILKDVPSAQVVTFPADVKDPTKAEEAVKLATSRFGRLDVLIANAGAVSAFDKPLADKDANEWWNTFEVNVRGVYNYLRAATHAILETKGSIIVVSSTAAQLRFPHGSDYGTSKFALGRLIEFAALEQPDLRVFVLHPGVIETALVGGADLSGLSFDTAALPAATALTISAGKAEWLRGRFWSSNWDIGEGEVNWKEKTLEHNGLVNKLFIPD
ncbi:NAD-P-binding protein [Russula brevipes]|nr:NAD-P-binding protein [Russula brevipes]